MAPRNSRRLEGNQLAALRTTATATRSNNRGCCWSRGCALGETSGNCTTPAQHDDTCMLLLPVHPRRLILRAVCCLQHCIVISTQQHEYTQCLLWLFILLVENDNFCGYSL